MRPKLGLIARLTLALLSFSVLGAGCVQISTNGAGGGGADGGIWKSADKGEGWVQKSLISTTAPQKRSIGATSISAITMDPQDHNALYIGTTENGLFYTLDGGESWVQAKTLASGRVPSVVVDPKNKCVIYAASGNKVLKSSDCARSWQTVYFETRTDKPITVLSIDAKEGRAIFAGTVSGDLLLSTDAGNFWTSVNRFKSEVKNILVAPYDPKIIYVGTKSSGVWRSVDAGASWEDLSGGFKQFSGAFEYRDLVLDLSAPEVLLYASQFGLLRTIDGGKSWNKLDLLTPPGAATIYSVAVNPKDGNEIYYGTATTFYHTTDGGKTWRTSKLPSSRAATALLVDPTAPNVLYLGVTRLKQ